MRPHRSLLLPLGAAIAMAVLASPGMAAETPEHLIQSLPPGFDLADSHSQPGMDFKQYVPAGQSSQGWSRVIINQAFASNYPPPPSRYVAYLVGSWVQACPASSKPVVNFGYASGRPAATLELDCPKVADTGKPEHTLFQIIRGTTALYIAQYSFRSEPSATEHADAVAYLKSVGIAGTAPDPTK